MNFFYPIAKLIRIYQKYRYGSEEVKFFFSSEVELKKVQIEKLNKLIQHYKKYHPNQLKHLGQIEGLVSVDELKEVKVMSKELLNSSFSYYKNLNYKAQVDSTSGSSGVNFSFLLSKTRRLYAALAHEKAYDILGYHYFKSGKITFWGSSATSSLKARLFSFLKSEITNNKVVKIDRTGSISIKKLERCLVNKRIKLLNSYPSILTSLLSGYKGERRDDLLVTLSGETIQKHQIEIIKSNLSKRIANRYGSREFGLIGHQFPEVLGTAYICPASRFIIESDSMGRILITDLDNYSFPFIRYEIGDIGEISIEKSKLGTCLVLNELSGRTSDVVVTKSGEEINPQYWTLLSRSVPGILEFQILKNGYNIEFNAVVDSHLDSNSLRDKITKLVDKEFGGEIEFSFKIVPKIKLTETGKRKIVLSV